MAIRHEQLGKILEWKHGPVPGMNTRNGELVGWPEALGSFPDDTVLQAWIDEYEAIPEDSELKDLRVARLKKFQAIPRTVPGLMRFMEEEVLPHLPG